ncbi:bactofilin family protein [Serratia microhaemolytica]|uniref:bactofilin family protein n=1 Tax=Serratia microhaemolytica TaxID=2675110 RepID=UPI00139236E4|nr:polymer-forming cytoskeletal protein [Serratia microhaemolytica]
MLSFNKQKKVANESKPTENVEQREPQVQLPAEPQLNQPTETVDANKPVRAKKDTFISNGTSFTGVIKADGNIVVEGQVEGNIISMHIVRIENSGYVKGEVRAQQIVVNGVLEGSCYTESVSIQPKGSIRGDIYADEISIEKGGTFIGQSQPMQPNSEQPKITVAQQASAPFENKAPASQSPAVKQNKA